MSSWSAGLLPAPLNADPGMRLLEQAVNAAPHLPVLNLRDDFGAVPNGSPATNARAFMNWYREINTVGAAIAVIPPGVFPVAGPKSSIVAPATGPALCPFTNLSRLILIALGTVTDTNTYAASETGTLYSFSACKNITASATVTAPTSVTADGLVAFQFFQGCKGISLDLDITGGGHGAWFYRNPPDDPESYRTSGISAAIRSVFTQYPLLCDFSGDDIEAWVDTANAGRGYFGIANDNYEIHLRNLNQRGASMVAAFRGYGFGAGTIYLTDTNSTVGNASNEMFLVQYSDEAAASCGPVTIHLDTVSPPGSPTGATIAINKVNNQEQPDTLARGHVLRGLTVTGTSRQTDGVDHVHVIGAFPAGDSVQNVVVRDLTALSTGTSHVQLGNLLPATTGYGMPTFDHVHVGGGNLCASTSGTVTNATDASPIVLTFAQNTDAYNGMSWTFAGIGGNTAANGTFYVQRIDARHVALYSNAALTSPVAGSGAYTSGGSGYAVGTGEKAVYLACKAANYTAGISDPATADYFPRNTTDGATQSVTNKRFI